MAVTRPRVDADALADAIGLGPEELAMRKGFLEFGDDDVHRLHAMYELTHEHVDVVIEAFYEHLMSFPETAAFFRDPRLLEHVKGRQKEYFIRLTQGDYEQQYVTDRLRLGSIHERIGLPVRSFLGMYAFYLRQIASLLLEEHPGEPGRAFEAFHSLTKLLFFDIGLGVDIYIYQRERTIALQQEAIRELSTPVLTLRDRLLVLPIIGILDTSRAQKLTEGLLRSIRESRAKVVILDVTGQPPAPDRRGVAAHGRAGDRHGPLVERGAVARDARRRPDQAERRRRSPGRDRGRQRDHGLSHRRHRRWDAGGCGCPFRSSSRVTA